MSTTVEIVRRSWRERLFTLPWRPFDATDEIYTLEQPLFGNWRERGAAP